MAERRFYWLKLKEDFFESKRIKKLRRLAGGDTLTIIYLKMQLKSIKTDGVLRYTGLEKSFAEELALDLDENPEDVGLLLNYLLSVGLIETSDNINFLLPYAVESTGSEGASAERVRNFRERQKTPILTKEAKTNAERQKAYRAKQGAEKRHIPLIDDHMNGKRYSGNYYLVMQRDRYKCAMCDSTENLCVHHIDGYDENKPQNNAVNKMIVLCRSCHSQVHSGALPIPEELLDSINYDADSNENGNVDVTEVKRIGNVEIEKEIDKEKENKGAKRTSRAFTPPTYEEVKAYCDERKNGINPQHFIDYYQARGWVLSNGKKMVDFKAAIRTWEQRNKPTTSPQDNEMFKKAIERMKK